MIVSWNELQRTCQKAFRGLGVAAGTDDDSAFAVLWLQARGLDALTPLGAALSALEDARPRPLALRRNDDEVDVLDAGGQPAVSVASDALDYAVARALEREARAEVLLTGVEGGIFVAGALAPRPVPGRFAQVQWRDGEARRRLDVASNGECRLCKAPVDNADCMGGPRHDAVRIVVDATAGKQWMESSPPWCIDVDDAELERRAMHCVAHGIEMPNASWRRLLAFAGRTLVPATRASRQRGAGGGGDDND